MKFDIHGFITMFLVDMKKDEQTPETKPAGSGRPPRPPREVAIGTDAGGDDPGKRRKKETIRINLPPMPKGGPVPPPKGV